MTCPNQDCAKDMTLLSNGDMYCDRCLLMVCNMCHHLMERRLAKAGRIFHCDCMVFGLAADMANSSFQPAARIAPSQSRPHSSRH
jgi:hypothetical protein